MEYFFSKKMFHTLIKQQRIVEEKKEKKSKLSLVAFCHCEVAIWKQMMKMILLLI